MKNYDQSVKINHNPNWPYIPDHPYRVLIIGDSGSEKTNALSNFINHWWPDTDKFYLYTKDLFESKYQLLINGREKVGNGNLKNPKPFIDSSQTIDDIYKNSEVYNWTKERRVLIVFDDADMESSKKLSLIVTEL